MTANSLTFRLATPDDAVPLADLINAAFRVDPTTHVFLTADHSSISVVDAPTILAMITNPAYALLVAADPAALAEAPLVAHCSVRKADDSDGRRCAWFGLLAVDEGCRGRGFGVQSVTAAEDHARRELGARRMEFDVVGARVDLVAWYERRGYLTTGERKPFPYEYHKDWQGVLRDDLYFVTMGKDLEEAST